MVCIFIDGFDKYGVQPNTNATLTPNVIQLLSAGWSISGTQWSLATGLSNTPTFTGACLVSSGGAQTASRSLGANYSRLIGGIRFTSTLANSAACLAQFMDTTNAQCSITVSTSGNIVFRNGSNSSATTIATSTFVASSGVAYYLEWDITFSATGAYNIYINGTSIMSGTGNTKTSANNYANIFELPTAAGTTQFDDLYLFDSTGTTNNAVLLTNPRIETVYPVSDAQAQFTVGASILGSSLARVGAVLSSGANIWYVRPFIPTVNCTINGISVRANATSATVNHRPLLYTNSGTAPQTLMSSGSTVTGTTAGSILSLPLTTPQSLTAGTQYWLGIMVDSAVTSVYQEGDANNSGRQATVTFSSGAPATAPGTLSSNSTIALWGNITLATAANYYENTLLGLGYSTENWNFVDSSTVGNEDLFNMNALSAITPTIYVAATKAYLSLSASGVRTGSAHTKSGTTDVGGTSVTPTTSYTWVEQYLAQDPATSAAWTVSGANAALAGYRVDT